MAKKIKELRNLAGSVLRHNKRGSSGGVGVMGSITSDQSQSTDVLGETAGNQGEVEHMNHDEIVIDYQKLCDDIYICDWI
jgi:hypothetical protein